MLMAGVLYLLMLVLPDGRLITIGLILIGVAVYAGTSLLIGTLKKDEIIPLLKRLKS